MYVVFERFTHYTSKTEHSKSGTSHEQKLHILKEEQEEEEQRTRRSQGKTMGNC